MLVLLGLFLFLPPLLMNLFLFRPLSRILGISQFLDPENDRLCQDSSQQQPWFCHPFGLGYRVISLVRAGGLTTPSARDRNMLTCNTM